MAVNAHVGHMEGMEDEEPRKEEDEGNRPTENVVRGQWLTKGLHGYRLWPLRWGAGRRPVTSGAAQPM